MLYFRHIFFVAALLLCQQSLAALAVALNYGERAPLSELKVFDIVIVEPGHGYDPVAYRRNDSELYAYVSVAEARADRSYVKEMPESWKIGHNGDWGSLVIDQTPAEWPAFFADKVVGPLWAKGYRGFFLDTLDSYRLARSFDEKAQQAGLVRVIETLHARFPGIHLILNRGFEIVPRVRDKIQMVAAESLFRGWNAATQRYEEVPASDRAWLVDQLQTIQQRDGIPALVIDYVTPGDRATTRATAEKIKALGFTPWVTDSALESIGIGAIEAVPRRILVLYNSKETPSLNYTPAHNYLAMPLNHMGYIVDYADANAELPKNIRADRYAGIVTWFSGGLEAAARPVARWLSERIGEGMPVAVVGSFGFPVDSSAPKAFGFVATPPSRKGALRIVRQDPMMGFETPPRLALRQPVPLQLADRDARPLVELNDDKQQAYVGGALTRWGGFILDPFVLFEMAEADQFRWVVDPFAFLSQALRLPAIPVPDVTTENGRRLFFSHIDGDGFPSVAELPGRPFAAEALLKDILEKYRVPTTVSVIESEVAPDGLYPKLSPQLEAIARRIFALPHVEIASHTYSHPFLWDLAAKHGTLAGDAEEYYHLDIPGYKMDLHREIVGSVDYIRRRLAPPDKPVNILLWSGDTSPGADALGIVDQAGLLNMNGGDTWITRSAPTLTAVRSLGIEKDGHLQVFAPITNENIYTNLWRGPYYGYERAIETFEMTGSPRRLKPVDIYYHFYSASKAAGLKALHKAFDWAQGQPLFPLFASEYIRKVQDFHSMALARDEGGWRVRGDGNLRTLRLPAALGRPDIDHADSVAGFMPAQEGSYLHLTGPSARFSMLPGDRDNRLPYLREANGRLSDWRRQDNGRSLSFRLAAYRPLSFSLARSEGCAVRANGRPLAADRRGDISFSLPDAATTIDISCPAR